MQITMHLFRKGPSYLVIVSDLHWTDLRRRSHQAVAVGLSGIHHRRAVDAFVTYDLPVAGKKVSLQLNVKNMFDRTYYQSAVNQYFVSIGDPRRVSLTASVAL